MAIKKFFIISAMLLCALGGISQTVYYPATSSELLQSTAKDVAALLQKAVSGSSFTTQPYTIKPSTGIVFMYDSAVNFNNQTCKVQGNGSSYLSFAASQDNGLSFGIYQYLYQTGFRFYQPGTIWEIIPSLTSAFNKIDTLYTCQYKYKNWFISGGHNTWAMDSNGSYYWDTYYGDNGHAWAQYQRRNNMTGGYRFTGHRDDIMTTEYLNTLQANPCYVAPFDGLRSATGQSVPDVNSAAAMQWWSNSIGNKYTKYKSTIYGNKDIYANLYRNFNYSSEYIGLEVPDGAHWANTTDNAGCGSNNILKASDQQFTLANYTAAALNAVYPNKKFQVYAYDSHADVPSANIAINKNIDVQIVPTAFQNETSAKGLLNRWYGKTSNISEYHYLNIAQWSGETPSISLNDLKTTLARLKENKSQGIVWEAAPSKFASLPFLLAANQQLKDGVAVDVSLQEFCNNLFGTSSKIIYKLLQMWSNEKTVTVSNGIQDNKYKLPLYFKLVNDASTLSMQDAPIVQQRLLELKAYLHYMVLYYNWVFDQRSYAAKAEKAANFCLYLAKINRLQIVNSYFLISDIVNKYPANDIIYIRYNTANGTAYLNGALPLITAKEINQFFIADNNAQQALINQYSLEETIDMRSAFFNSNLIPLENIQVAINYTYGKNYPSRSEFFIKADKAGSFQIKYQPAFGMPAKGYINFTVESDDKTLGIVKDFSINQTSSKGILYVALPAAGTYKLTISTLYKASLKLEIVTNGNAFYKNGPFLGNTIENYRSNLLSLPGYFYVPAGIKKVYFSINNSNPGGAGFATPTIINSAFLFKDNNNNPVEAKLAGSIDSALFYLDIPQGMDGQFWQSFKMEQYRLCFANISNVQWYGSRKNCSKAGITVDFTKIAGECITQLSTNASSNNLLWKVYDGGSMYEFSKQTTVVLPNSVSPNAIITLIEGTACITTKRLGDEAAYNENKANCASGSALPISSLSVAVYPNPGYGMYKIQQSGQPALATTIEIFTTAGTKLVSFANTQQFNITQLPAGVYIYQTKVNELMYRGKLVKI